MNFKTTKLWTLNDKIALLILCLAFAASHAFYTHLFMTDEKPTNDAREYLSIAESILSNLDTYSRHGNEVDISTAVTPFYSLLIAVPYYLSGYKLKSIYLFQVSLSFFSVILFFRLTKKLTAPSIALFVSICLLLYYPIWKMNYAVLMEVSTLFLLLMFLFLLHRFFDSWNVVWLNFSIMTLTFLVLLNNRFIVHYAIILFILGFVLTAEKQNMHYRNQRKKPFRHYLPVFLVSLACIAGWNVKQAMTFKEFVIFTPKWTELVSKATGGIIPSSQVMKNIGEERKPKDFLSYEKALEFLKTGSLALGKQTAQAFTYEHYSALRKQYESTTRFDVYADRIKNFFRVGNLHLRYMNAGDPRLVAPSSFKKIVVDIGILLPVFLFSCIGAYFSVKNKDIFMQAILALIFAHVALHTIVHFIERYRIAILPLFFILAAYGMQRILLIGAPKKAIIETTGSA